MPESVYNALEEVAKAQLSKLLPDGKVIRVPDGATPADTTKACTHEALKHSCGTTPIRPGYCFTVKHHAEFGAAPREHLLPTRVPREKFCLTLLCVSVWTQRVRFLSSQETALATLCLVLTSSIIRPPIFPMSPCSVSYFSRCLSPGLHFEPTSFKAAERDHVVASFYKDASKSMTTDPIFFIMLTLGTVYIVEGWGVEQYEACKTVSMVHRDAAENVPRQQTLVFL